MMQFRKRHKVIKRIAAFLLVVFLAVTGLELLSVTDAQAQTEYEKFLEQAGFPSSYWPMLTQLHEAHPNWSFVAFQTNLDWDTVIKNEMTLNRNLVPNTIMTLKGVDAGWYKTPTSWKSTSVTGSYDWAGNDWVKFSGGGYAQASIEAVEYIMDPRNWMTEENIFEFEQLGYNAAYQTYDVVRSMLENSFMDCDYAKITGDDGNSYDYAQVFIMAAEQLYAKDGHGVSPVHLAARVIQEQGRGTLNTATGQYVCNNVLVAGSVLDGVTYYNYFNVGASGSSNADVIANGTARAKTEGWTTPYKAIIGGASTISTNYIAIGQDTLYFQKFSVVDPAYYYWKQYMQNLLAPVNEGWTAKSTYESLGLVDTPFTFEIPVYNNMPEQPCPRPTPLTSTANPNYKLSSISVSGTDMFGTVSGYNLTPSFNMDTASYSIVVPYITTSININATPIASTSTVSGAGTKQLAVGENVFKIVCKSEYGTSKTYTVTVNRAEGSTLLKGITPSCGALKEPFDSMTTAYTMSVGKEGAVMKLAYQTESEVAYVVMRQGETETVCADGTTPEITLTKGENIIYLDVYPSEQDNSLKTTYVVTITWYDEASFETDYQISDEAGTINGFTVGDKISTVLSKIKVYNGTLNITDAKGQTKKETDVIGTGDHIILLNEDGTEQLNYQTVVFGDVNGDGKIDIMDMAIVKNYVWYNGTLSGVKLIAADVSTMGTGVDLLDMAIIKNYVWYSGSISQVR